MAILRNLLMMFIGLIAVIFLILRFGPASFLNLFRDPFKGMNKQFVDDNIGLQHTRSSTEEDETIFESARQLARAEDWPAVSSMLADAIESRKNSVALKRDYELITAGARAELTTLLSEFHPEHCKDELDQLLAQYDAAADAAPADAGLAAISARAHLDAAWEWRGDGYANGVSDAGWRQMHQHVEIAQKRLHPFVQQDPINPVIAHAAHIAARQNDDDGRDMRNIYEKWRAADPANITLYTEHGFHLLPRWFGSYEELATEAQRAAATHHNDLGAAPYLWLYWPSLDCEPTALLGADPDFFVDAVSDHIRLEATSFAPNHMLKTFSEIWLSNAIGAQQREAEKPVQELAERVCRMIIEKHLHEIDLKAWDTNATEVKKIVALLYKQEIDDGYRLDFSNGSLELVARAA